MVRLKKHIFIKLVCTIVVVLFIVRLIWQPAVGEESTIETAEVNEATIAAELTEATENFSEAPVALEAPSSPEALSSALPPPLDFSYKHPVRSVHSYADCFPDLQDLHYAVATRHGVPPVQNRSEAEHRKKELVYVGANPFYRTDPAMHSSIPYLVPRASLLLQEIARNFLDSLAVKQIPLHTIIVTSVLRTEEDVARLRRINGNASEQSCHRFGTTFDISYNRYHTVSPPGEPERRAVRNDTLKFVLSEVLRDLRAEGRCYVKHEVKQGCFHITTR